MAIIRTANKEKIINSLNIKRELGILYIDSQSTKTIILDYFLIINKILTYYTKDNNEDVKHDIKRLNIVTESMFSSKSRAMQLNYKSESYKEKSFFEKVSFCISVVRDTIKILSIDNSIEFLNTYKEKIRMLNELSNKTNELKRKLDTQQTNNVYDTKEINEDEAYEKELYLHFKKYPEYKQIIDECNMLLNRKAQKIEQINNLFLDLNTFREYILNEFNPIVSKLLYLLEENELNLQIEYIKISEKLKEKIEFGFNDFISQDIIKSGKLLKWDELKNFIERLEQENKTLDEYIDGIVENEFFKSYTKNELTKFNIIKSKLNLLINQNEIITTKLPEIEKDRNEDKTNEILNKKLGINNSDIFNQSKEVINQNNIQYSKHIKSIENSNFEKIRRYCNNLQNDNKSDDMQKYLSENGKMYKAIIYDSLEQFIAILDEEVITLIDWGCNQGIGSMLILDYIKEKQLNTKINQIILIDDNKTAMNRAIAHINALKQDDIELLTIQNNDEIEMLKNIKNNIIINLSINDKIDKNIFKDLDFDIFTDIYFMFLSNDNVNFINDIFEDISLFNNTEDISIRDNKIGRFKRFERIFKINNQHNSSEYVFDEDEIPF